MKKTLKVTTGILVGALTFTGTLNFNEASAQGVVKINVEEKNQNVTAQITEENGKNYIVVTAQDKEVKNLYVRAKASNNQNFVFKLDKLSAGESAKFEVKLLNIQVEGKKALPKTSVVQEMVNFSGYIGEIKLDVTVTYELEKEDVVLSVKPEVQSEVKPEVKPEVQPEIKLEVQPETKPEVKPETKPEVQPEVKPEEKPETKPEVQPENKPEVQPEVKPEVQPETKPETKPEVQPETKPEVKPETKPETKPEVKPEVQPEIKLEVQPETKSEVQPEVQPETKPEVKPEVQPEIKPEVQPEAKPEVKPEVKPETKPEVQPETKPETKPEVKPEVKPEARPSIYDKIDAFKKLSDDEQLNLATQSADRIDSSIERMTADNVLISVLPNDPLAAERPKVVDYIMQNFDMVKLNEHFINYLNADRKKLNRTEVYYETGLQKYTQIRAEEDKIGAVAHVRPDGTDYDTVVTGTPYAKRLLNENSLTTAVTTAEELSSEKYMAKRLYDQWYNSKSHRDNMLNENIQSIAVGLDISNETAGGIGNMLLLQKDYEYKVDPETSKLTVERVIKPVEIEPGN